MTRPERHDLLPFACITMLVASLAATGIVLTRDHAGLALLWLPNAVLAGWLLRTHAEIMPFYIAAFVACLSIINWLAGDGWVSAGTLAFSNAIEVITVVWLLRRFCGRHPDMGHLANHGALLLAIITASGLSAVLAGFGRAGNDAFFSMTVWQRWALGNGLSLLILLPTSMIVIDAWRHRRRPDAVMLRHWAMMTVMVLGGSALIFMQSRFPFLFLASPLVLYAAFRTGLLGTAAATVMITGVALVATSLNTGPITLVQGDLQAQFLCLQLFLACNFAMGLPVAATLADRARDQLRLQRRPQPVRQIQASGSAHRPDRQS